MCLESKEEQLEKFFENAVYEMEDCIRNEGEKFGGQANRLAELSDS